MEFEYGSEENLRKIINALTGDNSNIDIYLVAHTTPEFEQERLFFYRKDEGADTELPLLAQGDKPTIAQALLDRFKVFCALARKEKVLPGLNIECESGDIKLQRVESLLYSYSRSNPVLESMLDGLADHASIFLGHRPRVVQLKNYDIMDRRAPADIIKRVMNESSSSYKVVGCSFELNPQDETRDHYYNSHSNDGYFSTREGVLRYNGPNAAGLRADLEKVCSTPLSEVLADIANRKEVPQLL